MRLSAYALALYGCLMYLRLEARDDDLTVIIDKTTKAQNQANLAEAYAKSDTYVDLKTDSITVIPLKKDDSFKTVIPIQAVDWLAWEVRKNSTERLTWKPSEDDRKTIVGVYRSYEKWKPDFEKEHGRAPRDRKSAWALYKAKEPRGIIWDYQTILGAHVNRHKNGWGAEPTDGPWSSLAGRRSA
jgi:hypothetical protein